MVQVAIRKHRELVGRKKPWKKYRRNRVWRAVLVFRVHSWRELVRPAAASWSGSSGPERASRALADPLPSPVEAETNGDLFLLQGLDLADQRVNFFRCQFAGVLGHVAFSVGDNISKVFRRGGRGFVRDKRRPAKMAALGRFPVTLRTVFLVDGVCGEA